MLVMDGVAMNESSTLIRHVEQMRGDRPAFPSDPGYRFLLDLLEDFADEWLVKLM